MNTAAGLEMLQVLATVLVLVLLMLGIAASVALVCLGVLLVAFRRRGRR